MINIIELKNNPKLPTLPWDEFKSYCCHSGKNTKNILFLRDNNTFDKCLLILKGSKRVYFLNLNKMFTSLIVLILVALCSYYSCHQLHSFIIS